jgi:MFS family permease
MCALMLTGLTATTSVGWLLVAYVVFGLGFGTVSAPVNNTALSGMPRAQSGVAAAIVSTGRQVGMTLGVAVAGALLASSLHGSIQTGLAPASHPAWWVMAGAGVLVIALALITTTAWAHRTAVGVGREVAAGSEV